MALGSFGSMLPNTAFLGFHVKLFVCETIELQLTVPSEVFGQSVRDIDGKRSFT